MRPNPKEILMLTALWHFSAAIRGYLRFYMPTNRAIDWLRTPRGFKWAIPVALVATPAYLGLTALAIEFAARPGLGFLNVLVFLFFWNAAKFAWMAVLSPLIWVGQKDRRRSMAPV
ncbi:MAG: sulfate permease [Pimelobacter sp.]|nr:sulfate permease [Pimelobacter sp.]